MNTYVIIGVSCLCLAFILIIVNLVYTKKRNNLGENLRQAGKRYLTFYISLYRRFSRIPILKKLLLNIRKDLKYILFLMKAISERQRLFFFCFRLQRIYPL